METMYTSADLAFLRTSLEELRGRVQALLRKEGGPLQRQGLTNLLQDVEGAAAALDAGPGEAGFPAKALETFCSAVYAQRRKIDQILDTPMCPADKRNEMVSAASAVNALLRKLRADLADREADSDARAGKNS